MAPSLKHVRSCLSSIGRDGVFAEALYNRCVARWDLHWDFGPAGIVAGGILAVPVAEYDAFVYGVKTVEKVAITPPSPAPAEAEDDESDPLTCKECGRHLQSTSALRAHMRTHG